MDAVGRGAEVHTLLTASDRETLARAITPFDRHVHIAPIGHYRTLPAHDLWVSLVGRVCVTGGSAFWDRLQAST